MVLGLYSFTSFGGKGWCASHLGGGTGGGLATTCNGVYVMLDFVWMV
jgi:hypothetical protein